MITVFFYVPGEVGIRTGRCSSEARNRDGCPAVVSAPHSHLTMTRLTPTISFWLLNE